MIRIKRLNKIVLPKYIKPYPRLNWMYKNVPQMRRGLYLAWGKYMLVIIRPKTRPKIK